MLSQLRIAICTNSTTLFPTPKIRGDQSPSTLPSSPSSKEEEAKFNPEARIITSDHHLGTPATTEPVLVLVLTLAHTHEDLTKYRGVEIGYPHMPLTKQDSWSFRQIGSFSISSSWTSRCRPSPAHSSWCIALSYLFQHTIATHQAALAEMRLTHVLSASSSILTRRLAATATIGWGAGGNFYGAERCPIRTTADEGELETCWIVYKIFSVIR